MTLTLLFFVLAERYPARRRLFLVLMSVFSFVFSNTPRYRLGLIKEKLGDASAAMAERASSAS